MPESLLAFRVVEGQQLNLAVLIDRGAQVTYLAVDFGSAYGLIKTHAD